MLSVVIPALNECETVGEVVAGTRDALAKAGITPNEIIVVDDGSTDGTAERAQGAGASVIRHPHSVGYGRSLKDGILAAQYDAIAITDADGTYPVQEIPKLYELWKQGYDMAVGARTGRHYRESLLKSPLRLVLRAIVEWTAGRRIPDINSGLRVFSRPLTLGFFEQLCDTFSFTTSLTLAYMMNSNFVAYREIAYYQRTGTTRVRLFRDAMKTMQFIIEAAVFYNPLKIFFLFAVICLACSALALTLGVLTRLATFFMLGVGGSLLAILVMSLGLVCVLLKQIMDHGRVEQSSAPLMTGDAAGAPRPGSRRVIALRRTA